MKKKQIKKERKRNANRKKINNKTKSRTSLTLIVQEVKSTPGRKKQRDWLRTL